MRNFGPPQGEAAGRRLFESDALRLLLAVFTQRPMLAEIVPSRLIGWSAQRHPSARGRRRARDQRSQRVTRPNEVEVANKTPNRLGQPPGAKTRALPSVGASRWGRLARTTCGRRYFFGSQLAGNATVSCGPPRGWRRPPDSGESVVLQSKAARTAIRKDRRPLRPAAKPLGGGARPNKGKGCQ